MYHVVITDIMTLQHLNFWLTLHHAEKFDFAWVQLPQAQAKTDEQRAATSNDGMCQGNVDTS